MVYIFIDNYSTIKKETIMKYRLLMTITLITLISFIVGCGSTEDHDTMHKDESIEKSESDIVRDYDVDVASLDENGDGNVFQCPMDWEVISDEPGSCPLCNMALKEYSVTNAKRNLEEHRPHNH
jgi:hypothetical protein